MHSKILDYCDFMSNNQCREVIDFDEFGQLVSETVSEVTSYGSPEHEQSIEAQSSGQRLCETGDGELEDWLLLLGVNEEEETENFVRRTNERYRDSGNSMHTGNSVRVGERHSAEFRDNDTRDDLDVGHSASYTQDATESGTGQHSQSQPRRQEVFSQSPGDIQSLSENGEDISETRSATPNERMFMESLRRIPARSRIIHDVMPLSALGGNNNFFNQFFSGSGRSYPGAIFIVSRHADHYHIIHDCTYSQSHCRCAIIRELRRNKRYPRRVVWTRDFGFSHWFNLINYLSQNQRQIVYFEIAGREWRHCYKAGNLPFPEGRSHGRKRLVESGRIESESSSFVNFMCGQTGDEIEGNVDERGRRKKRRRKDHERSPGFKLLLWLQDHLTSPLSGIKSSVVFMNSEWAYENPQLIENAFNHLGSLIMEKTTKEIYEMSEKCEHLFYIANSGKITDIYYNVEESIQIIEELLLFQCGSSSNVYRFLNELYNTLEKTVPKKNCLQIISEPNAGKTFFVDSVIHFYLAVGHIGNFNRYSNFPLAECVYKRVLLWNEPNCEPGSFETLKMLFGGDQLAVKVKYKNDVIINRTPVIVTSNKDIFPNDAAFRSRMSTHFWKPAPFLKKLKKKPYPFYWYYLLIKYDVVSLLDDDDEESDCTDIDEI